MMKTKVWIGLCALLLINLGLTEHTDDHPAAPAAPQSAPDGEVPPEAPATESPPGSSPDSISHAVTVSPLNGSETNPSSGDNSSLSSVTAAKEESIPVTQEPKKVNDTVIVPPSEAAVPENNTNLTDESTSQPPVPPSGSDAPTSQTPTSIATSGPTHSTNMSTADTPTTTSHDEAPPLPVSVTPTNQSTVNETHPSTPNIPTSEPPKPEATTAAMITQPGSTSSNVSSPPKPTSPHSNTQPATHHETSTGAHHQPTISPSAQAKPNADTPSQLNFGGDPTMVHDAPTLDPLLAGLVSAFIITAVIITLLLFLKLRRRDNRPEFRRLQDLPMDDMMEDTPLSMYSY
ncbi:mucin-2-like [Centropristis striata]|uniref:mucin-2-like n=1 Tax=Centropristis striata TaxID=184440 RepID=UPI0027E1C6FE|nr:mucin-2-like [Centropristis striata]